VVAGCPALAEPGGELTLAAALLFAAPVLLGLAGGVWDSAVPQPERQTTSPNAIRFSDETNMAQS
jgi:hypothetical protein